MMFEALQSWVRREKNLCFLHETSVLILPQKKSFDLSKLQMLLSVLWLDDCC